MKDKLEKTLKIAKEVVCAIRNNTVFKNIDDEENHNGKIFDIAFSDNIETEKYNLGYGCKEGHIHTLTLRRVPRLDSETSETGEYKTYDITQDTSKGMYNYYAYLIYQSKDGQNVRPGNGSNEFYISLTVANDKFVNIELEFYRYEVDISLYDTGSIRSISIQSEDYEHRGESVEYRYNGKVKKHSFRYYPASPGTRDVKHEDLLGKDDKELATVRTLLSIQYSDAGWISDIPIDSAVETANEIVEVINYLIKQYLGGVLSVSNP